ncbi:MAG: hypothetical protein HOI95_08830 [Chromatiales bacterium]|nr:hypothetical protein [Chromatiales bacterium]
MIKALPHLAIGLAVSLGSICGAIKPAEAGLESAFEAVAIATVQGRSSRLTVERGGPVLSWVRKTASGHALHVARVHADRLGHPAIVAEGNRWFINPFDRPSVVALSGTNLAAHWLERTGPTQYGYGIRMKFSRDNGKTWGATIVPHLDRAPVQHGFVHMLPMSSQSLRMVWLDGRQHTAATTTSEPMALLSANVDTMGRITNRLALDHQVCSCCQPALHRTSAGWVVAYRDRSASEIRDIAVTTGHGHEVKARTRLNDGWEIAGCPLNGPAIASSGKHLTVAWFTAAGNTPEVRIAFSSDGGHTFGLPIPVATDAPLGQVSSVALADESLLVGWLQLAGSQIEFRVRQMTASSAVSVTHTVLRSDTVIAAPQMACSGGHLYLAWEAMGSGKIQLARLESELGACPR